MCIYIVILIYLLLLTFQYDIKKCNKNYNKFNYIFSCIVLIMVAGVRYRIGYDTTNYMESFRYEPTLSELLNGHKSQRELLWRYIVGFSKEFGESFFVVQIIQSIIVNCSVFWFIRRHSPKPFLAVLLYYILLWWNLCFEAMREAIAVAFFLYALDALFNKGFKTYYLRVWPAVFAHTFGFVTLLFPFIKYLKINKYSIIFFLAIFCMVFSIKDYINEIVRLLEMTSDMAADKAEKYFNSDMYGKSNLSLNGIISMVVGGILPGISIILILNNKTKVGQNYLVPFVFTYICIVILRINIPIFFRFLNYFELLVIIAFTQAVSLERIKVKRRLVACTMAMMVFVRLYSLTAYDVGTRVRAYHRYVPYNSIFQKDINKDSEKIFKSKNF